MLSWSIAALKKHREHALAFEETLDLKTALQEREPAVLDTTDFQVSGQITTDRDAIIVDIHIDGQMTVPSTRSLMPVDLPINIDFTEIYLEPDSEQMNAYDETDVVFPLEGEMLQLQKAVEDNILLTIPNYILTPQEATDDQMPSGKDWAVISQNDYAQKQHQESVNPELAKLKQLLENQTDLE